MSFERIFTWLLLFEKLLYIYIYNINIYVIYNIYYIYYIYIFYIYIHIYHLTNHTGKFLTFDINNVVLYISAPIKIYEF